LQFTVILHSKCIRKQKKCEAEVAKQKPTISRALLLSDGQSELSIEKYGIYEDDKEESLDY